MNGHLSRRKKIWALSLLLVIIIKLFSLNASNVEAIYTNQFYYSFSKILRYIFGSVSFSIGDILYFLAAGWLLWKLIKNVRLIIKKQLNKNLLQLKFYKLLVGFIFIYIIFNIFWGLNYNRLGITNQLKLSKTVYDTTDLKRLQNILLQKVNLSKQALISGNSIYPTNKALFKRAETCYHEAEKIYPFLQYNIPSIKPSFYGEMGNYFGFNGYYNPFTGEAQVNTTVPKFLLPYIATHEMAHQIGYAKENEANFVGYLAAVNSRDTLFHYSVYLDLFLYANREVYYFDSVYAKQSMNLLLPQIRKDLIEWKQFNEAHVGLLEPAISWTYGKFLKLNEQPNGIHSYNAVVSMLIAYYKKFGKI